MNSKNIYHQLPLILIGAGGHAKVLLSLIQLLKLPILGVCAPEFVLQAVKGWRDIKVLGDDNYLDSINPSSVVLVNGIGYKVKNTSRRLLFDVYKKKGFNFQTLIHPFSFIDNTVLLEEGSQVMAGVVIQADCVIGPNVIVNSSASIDHDCKISSDVHVAPGAVLCGNVSVAEEAFIGSGATLSQGISVGSNAIIGAGSSVVRNVAPGEIVIPSPMRRCFNK